MPPESAMDARYRDLIYDRDILGVRRLWEETQAKPNAEVLDLLLAVGVRVQEIADLRSPRYNRCRQPNTPPDARFFNLYLEMTEPPRTMAT